MFTLVAATAATGLAVALAVLLLPSPAAHGVARSLQLAREPLRVPEVTPLAGRTREQRVWRPLLAALTHLGLRITPAGTPARLRRRLDLLGNRWSMADVLAAKAMTTLALGSAGALLAMLCWGQGRPGRGLMLFAVLSALGYWLIDLLLHNAGQKRQAAMRQAAPDALDMLTVCIEAGLGFDAALLQVSENTTGPLSAEFSRVIREIQLGRSRTEVFTSLAARADIPEITSFVTALVQADRLGVPIAGVLREQSAELRTRRRQRAEETAQKIPVKIIFPVLLCIFPVFFIIVIGPGAIRISQVFFHG